MPNHRVLEQMLDRLYASLMRGPSLNCRPHSSRQRVDLASLRAFQDPAVRPAQVLDGLLGEKRRATLSASVAMPEWLVERARSWGYREKPVETPAPAAPETPEEVEERRRRKEAEKAWRAQESLLTKLRNLSEDAKTYEQDTGVHALHLGYPLLSIPPGASGGTRRIIAPLAFVPVSMEVRTGQRRGIDLQCRGEGVDLVTPNVALLAWLERETGQTFDELFDDEDGTEPWVEVRLLVEAVTKAAGVKGVDAEALCAIETLRLADTPKADELPSEPAVLPCSVVGLFPTSKQGLIRDTRDMIAAEALDGPVVSFVDVEVDLDDAPVLEGADPESVIAKEPRRFDDERFIARADPFQAQAVKRARTSTGLVIHGPPGTGKSQTITNIIGDHLARGERVLFVCDKRTALDVVANRLEHLGLGRLCAVVHDPKRDQRSLYMGIRDALEGLVDLETDKRAAKQLEACDVRLQELHDELTALHGALMDEREGQSIHELMGRWLAIEAPGLPGIEKVTASADELDTHRRDIQVLLERAATVDYPHSPWTEAVGTTLDAFLARRQDELRRTFASSIEDARAADATCHETIPRFDPERTLAAAAESRTTLHGLLQTARESASTEIRRRVAGMNADTASRGYRGLADLDGTRDAVRAPLDRELALSLEGSVPAAKTLNADIGALRRYLETSKRWWGFLAFGAKRTARKVLAQNGLTRTPEEAERLRTFLEGVRARLLFSAQLRDFWGEDGTGMLRDEQISKEVDGFDAALALVCRADLDGELPKETRAALADDEQAERLLEGLHRSPPRAAAITALMESLSGLGLLAPTWLEPAEASLRAGGPARPTLEKMESRFDDIEAVLRVKDAKERLPTALQDGVARVLAAALDPGDGLGVLERCVLAREIEARVTGDEELLRLDGARIRDALRRYAEEEARKRQLVRDALLHRWVETQKRRLLAATRSRLNSEGAALRRRLFVRGKRAMRLRQVIASGETDDPEGDPLFDMCPVWMASPETVAQVFPRRAMFDVVVFDEASQCRLEEALPVLSRARKAVIAGDPKQLPPTRFFEASVATSDDDELETEQDLFEAQQGSVEDLLAAALNLAIEESYLEVHYRSRDAALIQFSNENFYGSRLQAIPGHPSKRARIPPIRIERADGVYRSRCNPLEAERVVQIVDDLLKRAEPPSIGIACFNLKQRDTIRDMLDRHAQHDTDFARRLDAARRLTGEGSFEGLFVKNLESVQGDERDHIIISTTYGPNEDGKFYRRFGPLGMAGGGRRLNVLVTRARHEVHLVTSIPADAYRALEPVPDGRKPSGAWLLFAYLHYAERLADIYREENERLDEAMRTGAAEVVRNEIAPVSRFGLALGSRLASTRGIGSDVHWGNEGFCVDAALHHPERVEDVTAGVLCDFTRYPGAPDAIEWEVFRSQILESQGWALHRVWTPHFFRDPERSVNAIAEAAEAALTEDAS